ncbi:HK97 family phage prohead protease [Enterovirga aerilata]|nr:HK97 family phage prohead protease [Enterovirga sp. DB1703]
MSLGLEVKFASGAAEGTFSGYGSVFNHEDFGGDVIAKGAFAQTLREWKARGKLPKMLLQHGPGLFGGSAMDAIPLGQWTGMSEDTKGLYVEGRLLGLDTDRGRAVHEAMKAGELDGLSIGYRVKEFTLGTKPSEPYRTIKRLDLFEVSVVLFGMNDQALVDNVKSIASPADLERFLHRAGFSRAEAKRLTAAGWSGLSRSEPNTPDPALTAAADAVGAALADLRSLSSLKGFTA